MHPLLLAGTGLLVAVLSAAIVWAADAYWRKRPIASFRHRLTTAVMFAFVGWSAVDWLREAHPSATTVWYIAVWVQLVSAFGIAGLMLIMGWRRPGAARSLS